MRTTPLLLAFTFLASLPAGADTKEVIYTAEFYQHAGAMNGAWSVGGADNAMLDRIAGLVAEFTARNFATAVGGPTGKPESKG